MAGPKKDVDPEELMRKKFRAKCLFRALIRLVMANAHWLIEGIDQYVGDDVKRRVEQAVRTKVKKKQLLNINDKALLNKPAEERTDQQKKYIYRIIGGLKCFKRYPNNVKKRLAAATYFKYFGPGRVIVRQHQEAHAMYFIVSGDVKVSQLVYDELIHKYVSVDVGAMHTGDMFGEVSLLHSIPRTATVTTVDHCEVLALMKDDFKHILHATIQRQWDEVRRAMSAFTYFDALDEVACREGCIVAKMKSYEVNETILGDGVGIHNFVYFILSGQCQMIESIQVFVTTRLGKNYYTLYDPYVPSEESESDLDKKYFKAYNLTKAERGSDATVDDEQEQAEYSKKGAALSKSILLNRSNKQKSQSAERIDEVKNSKGTVDFEGLGKQETKTIKGSRNGSKNESISKGSAEFEEEAKSEDFLKPIPQKDRRESIRISVMPDVMYGGGSTTPKQNFRTYFMQVCLFNAGACFGIGESMRDRRIIALTPVSCMLLPKVWLFQRNTANIWSRIQHYLKKKIPTKKQLFKEFVSARRWQEFREDLVENVLARSNTVNWTTIHDVPYSIRLEETQDI
ncbi:uncharacterized protein LOC112056606 [Bicyclus anynana]|uniref:Uncharacterized protein LOC112056606 n=1 Tax=Bicyclus anynana TaxID=110368 RepID=A0A6J1P4U7_BICAN|nr:uncharacterized protein LOC112056606 [Bicyclus anynana]